MAQKPEHCEHCGKVLPQEEEAYVYEGQVVCHRCNESLRHPTYVTQTKSVSGLGIAALVLGLIACLGCWIPMCGIFSLPFAILGALFGVIGIIIAKLTKKSSVGLPIAGTIVSITAAFIALSVTSAAVSSIEESATTITEGLDKTRAILNEARDKDIAEQKQTQQAYENNVKMEKQAYVNKIKIMNLQVAETVFDNLGVFGEIKNIGNRTLTEIEITICYHDKYGNTIYEETHYPLFVSSRFSDSTPLKPNYSIKFGGYKTDDVPSEWSKKIKVYVTNIEFEK